MQDPLPSPSAQPVELRFKSGDDWCAASFYCSAEPGERRPIIVMAHGLGGVKTMRLPAFAERFQAAGYACLVFDYRHFGESGGEPRQLLDIRKQLDDWKAAVAFARTLPEADPARVILWGTSFGGEHVLSIAADRADIVGVIAQCPFTDGLASSLTINPVTSIRLTTLAMLDRIGSWLGLPPVHVSIATPPGQLALMTAPDAFAGFMAIQPAGSHVINHVCARIALDIIRYFPGRRTPAISAPVLFCVCETDSVAPAGPTLRHAARAPLHEIKTYRDGHFEIYLGDAFERVVRDQLDFLRRVAPA